MKIKKVIFITMVILLSASLLSAAYYKKPVHKASSNISFIKGTTYVTPQIGLYSGAIPFGASLEYAMTENIGIGATLMVWFGSGYSVFIPSADAAYHLTMLNVEKLDLFAGVSVGFAVVGGSGTTGASGIHISPFIAARYWFSDNLGISLREDIGVIGDWTGVSSALGVVLKL
jgi:hypothetical protein